MNNSIARLAYHESNEITVDTTHGYIIIENGEMLDSRLVKTGELSVGDLIERWTYQDANGATIRREYSRVTSIEPVKGGARIGFTHKDGTTETDELFNHVKYGWGKQWWIVNEELSA